jgi:hypothetical protein
MASMRGAVAGTASMSTSGEDTDRVDGAAGDEDADAGAERKPATASPTIAVARARDRRRRMKEPYSAP